MFKCILKWFFSIALLAVIALAIFLINLIWFRPWSLNLFYEKVFAETVFSEPELLTQLGLVEQFGITSHNGKLSDESPAHQQMVIDRWKKDLTQLHEYPLDRQSPSQKLSTHVLDWFVKDQVDGEKWQWHNYPVNQLFGVQNQYPSFMANTHRLGDAKDCEDYIIPLDDMPPNEVHELGLREVTRIENDMRALLDANGFAGQPIGDAMDKLGKDPRFLYSNDDKGRANALAEYKRLIDNAVMESKAHLFTLA